MRSVYWHHLSHRAGEGITAHNVQVPAEARYIRILLLGPRLRCHESCPAGRDGAGGEAPQPYIQRGLHRRPVDHVPRVRPVLAKGAQRQNALLYGCSWSLCPGHSRDAGSGLAWEDGPVPCLPLCGGILPIEVGESDCRRKQGREKDNPHRSPCWLISKARTKRLLYCHPAKGKAPTNGSTTNTANCGSSLNARGCCDMRRRQFLAMIPMGAGLAGGRADATIATLPPV